MFNPPSIPTLLDPSSLLASECVFPSPPRHSHLPLLLLLLNFHARVPINRAHASWSVSLSVSSMLFSFFALSTDHYRSSFEALKVIFKLNLWEKIFNPNISSEIGKSLGKKKKDLLHAIGREIEDGYLRWNVNVDFNYSGEMGEEEGRELLGSFSYFFFTCKIKVYCKGNRNMNTFSWYYSFPFDNSRDIINNNGRDFQE